MSLLVESGDSLYGCIAVLHGRDLRVCTRHDVEDAVEAQTGLSARLQRLFLNNKKILVSKTLAEQGLSLGSRLDLHIAIKGGMPHPQASPVLEEHYADSDGEKSNVIDSISECVFTDPVFTALTGHTYSRSTLVQNNLVDPLNREKLKEEQIIPNINKATEVDQYLDRRLKADIDVISRTDFTRSPRKGLDKLHQLVAMIVDRTDLTACLNAKRLLTEVLLSRTDGEMFAITHGGDEKQFQALLKLARVGAAEKLEAKLLDARQRSDPASGLGVSAAASGSRPASLFHAPSNAASASACAPSACAPSDEEDSDYSDSDSDDDSYSDTSSVASRSSRTSVTSSNAGGRSTATTAATGSTSEKTTLKIAFVPQAVNKKDLTEAFQRFKPHIQTIRIINPGQGKVPKTAKRSGLVIFNTAAQAHTAHAALNGMTVKGTKLSMHVQRKREKKKSNDTEPDKGGSNDPGKKSKKKRSKAKKERPAGKDNDDESKMVPIASTASAAAAAVATAPEFPAKRTQSVSVKVENIHFSVQKDQIEKQFEVYGDITSIHLIPPADGKEITFCYVNYKHHEDAKTAISRMNAVTLNGMRIKCSLKPLQGRASSSSSTSTTVKVFPVRVGNLEGSATEDQLKEKFQEFGEVAGVNIKMAGSNYYAFVNFFSESSQKSASSTLHKTKYMSSVISVVVREAFMLQVDADAVRGLSPAGSTPPSSASYMNPGPVVSASGKVKSTGRKTDQTMPSSPPRPLMPPVPIQGRLPPGPLPPGHPPPGHMVPPHYPAGPPAHPGHYPPPGAPGPGPPHLLPSPPVHQPPVQLPPAPQVVAVSSNVHRAVIPLPESCSRLVQDRMKDQTDFHETLGTFVSYIDGQISVQGTAANSVKTISSETYKVVCEVLASQAPQPMSMPMAYGQPLPQQQQPLPPHMQHPQQQHPQQQQQQEQQQKQKQKGAPMPSPTTAASYPQSLATEILTVESHLMHFLVHRRGNLIDKLQEKHPDVEVRGFKTGSTTLEFVGEDCRQALEFVKARYNGYQSEEVSCKTELVEPACHAIRNNNSAIVYVPPPAPTSAKGGGGGGGGKKATPEITTLTIGALGRKPIDEVKQVLSSPDVANVNVPGDFLRTLRVHPTCSLTILREDFHVAYTVRRDQDAVILQGFAAEDLQAAADRLKEFVASQLALQEAKTEMLRCSSGVAMRFLKHALYTLQDENAQTAIEDIENRHSVSIGRNEDGQITIRGLSSCIASAQSDINSGVLLGNFKYKRHELPGKREAFMRLIKRTALKRIEDEHRVVCFMHYEQGKGGPVPRGNRRDSSSSETGRASGGAFRDKSAGHKAPSAATLGNIIIELCGIIQDELDVAFKQLQKIDVFSELWRLPSEEEFWMVDAWRKSGVLAKLDDQLEFFPDPKAKILFCNALTKAGAKGGIELVRQRIAKHRKEEVALPLTPALQQFIRVKRQDWLTDLEQIHGVKVNADSDEWTVVGSHEDVEQVCLKFQDLRDMCPTRRISFNPKNKRLFRHMSNRCKELRADLEDSHEATLAVSDVSRSNRGNDGHRGRGRGGSRGHGGRGRGGRGGRGGGAAAAVVDGDSADAVAGDDECVVTCVAGSQGDLDTVAEQVLEIEQLLCHIPLRLSEAHATLLREGLKARTVQTHQHRSNVFVDKTLAHINAMTREEAESMRDTIQAFIGGHETQHEEFAFPSDVVAQIVTSSEMRRVIDIASKRGVRVQKVYGTAGYSDSNDDGEGTPRSRRMHLSLSGLQDAVLDVRQELQQFVDQVAQSVETLQVCAQGLQVTALLDHVGDIRAVERQFKVSCTWTSLSRLARSAASHVNDDSDADDDADDDAYDGGHTATDQSSGAAQSASVSIGSFPAGIPVGDIAAKATAALARSQSIPLDATTVTGAINTMTSVRSRGLFSTLGSLFTRQSSTSSNDGASFTPAAAATATPTSTTPSSSLSSWQWQDNDGWKAYPADQCKSIDLASARGTKCDICIGTTRYRIDPVNMIQTNLETGFARRIRRTTSATASPATTGVSAFTAGGIAAADAGARASPATVTGGSAVWQYQDDTGAFSNYSSKHNAELEQQYLATPSGNAILSRGQYTYAVDFVNMQQTNLVTEKSRPVRRIHGSKTSSSAASSTSSSATTPLTTSFDPVKTGVVPREVQISIEGKSPSVQLAAAKIQQLLNDSIVEQKVSMTTGYTHWLSRRFKSVSASHLVSMEVTGVRSATSSVSSSSSSAAASSGKGQCVVLRGTKKRVERAETQVYKASAQAASRKQATSASAAAIAAASAAAVECPLPKEWEPMSGELELKQVALGSPEFNQVQKLVHFSLPNAKIQRIDRIQNKFLWKKYNQMKDSISEKIKTNAAEKLLFHGTRGNSPDKIYRSEVGFDMRYSSSGMWGQANYFASEAKYSDGYSHTAPHLNGERQIFLAKVIVGDSIEMTSTSGLRMPPVKAGVSSSAIGDIRYDTVNGVTNSTRVYMVYHNCQAYPFYLLTYRQS